MRRSHGVAPRELPLESRRLAARAQSLPHVGEPDAEGCARHNDPNSALSPRGCERPLEGARVGVGRRA
eukprot:1530093-Prymnesium_polylepis.1